MVAAELILAVAGDSVVVVLSGSVSIAEVASEAGVVVSSNVSIGFLVASRGMVNEEATRNRNKSNYFTRYLPFLQDVTV